MLFRSQRESEFNVVSKEISTLNNEISNNNVKVSQLNKQSRDFQQEIQDITDKIKNRNAERDVLTQLTENLNLIQTEKIEAARLSYRGYGETQPIIDDLAIGKMLNESEKELAHQKNRRTVYKIQN